LIIDSPVQINPVQPEGTSNQGISLFAILIAAIIIAIVIAVILLRKWPDRYAISFSKRYNLLSRITTKLESAHPPDEKREGAPFSPI
jgi:hypothetical protein